MGVLLSYACVSISRVDEYVHVGDELRVSGEEGHEVGSVVDVIALSPSRQLHSVDVDRLLHYIGGHVVVGQNRGDTDDGVTQLTDRAGGSQTGRGSREGHWMIGVVVAAGVINLSRQRSVEASNTAKQMSGSLWGADSQWGVGLSVSALCDVVDVDVSNSPTGCCAHQGSASSVDGVKISTGSVDGSIGRLTDHAYHHSDTPDTRRTTAYVSDCLDCLHAVMKGSVPVGSVHVLVPCP